MDRSVRLWYPSVGRHRPRDESLDSQKSWVAVPIGEGRDIGVVQPLLNDVRHRREAVHVSFLSRMRR